MTTKGLKPTPMKIRLAIARLIQLNNDTHPKRIAASVGLSPAYCKRLWREMERELWPDNRMALAVYAEMRTAHESYSERADDEERIQESPMLATG